MANGMQETLPWREAAEGWGLRPLVLGVVVGVSLACGLLAAEAALRFLAPQPIVPRYVETSPYGIRRNIAHVRGEMIAPEYRHRFATNSAGFRGTREYSPAKPAGTYRVLVLGDSVALGHGVGDDETFAALLERDLSRLGPTEVLNLGVSGFGTAEELIQLRHVGLAYEPDLVLLAYFPNDPYNNVVSRLFKVVDGALLPDRPGFAPALYIRDHLYSLPGWAWLCQHSHLVNLLRNRASGYFIHRLADENRVSARTSGDLTEREETLTAALLLEMNRELAARGIPFGIVTIPLVREGEIVQNFPAERLRREGNLPPVLDVGIEMARGTDPGELFYRRDGHPTRLGHRLIADRLSALLAAGAIGGGGAAAAGRTFAGLRMILDEEPFWADPAYADRALPRLKDAGFNAYSPNVWHGRGTTWPSGLAPRDPWLKDLPPGGPDPLKELIRKAHGRGLQIHAWFNIALRQSDLRPEFALPGVDSSGAETYDVHNPFFREWISDVVAEVAANYDVDGIMLDYIRAVQLCTSDPCAREYRGRYGRDLRADAQVMRVTPGLVPTLAEYQEAAVTSLVALISQKVRAVRPGALLSAAAFPDVAHLQDGQNSLAWLDAGLLDVVFRMDYAVAVNVALTDSLRRRLRRPDSLSVMISNVSIEELPPGQPHFARSGRWLADTISLIQRRWPGTGLAVYFYKWLSDEQIAALKAGPFKRAGDRAPAVTGARP
jgi:hypothetical protein